MVQYNSNGNGLFVPNTYTPPIVPTPSVAQQVAAAVSAQQPVTPPVAAVTPTVPQFNGSIAYNGGFTVTARLGSGNWAFNALLAANGYITAGIANACNVGGAIGACSKWLHSKGVQHTYYTSCGQHGGKGCIHTAAGPNNAMLALLNTAQHTHSPSPYCIPCLLALYTPGATVAPSNVQTPTPPPTGAQQPVMAPVTTPTPTVAQVVPTTVYAGPFVAAVATYANGGVPCGVYFAGGAPAYRLALNAYNAHLHAGGVAVTALQAALNAAPYTVAPFKGTVA